jgi:hypothetical protein
MRAGSIFFCAVLFLVAGCAELPRPATFPLTSQEQFQSATHWQRIAQRTILRLQNEVDLLKPDSAGSRPRIHVQTSDESPFGRAFRNYLITELINANFLLADDDAPILISWGLQLVPRDPVRLKPQGFPEFVAEAVWEFFSGARWTTRGHLVSHTELILTTRIAVGEDSPEHTVRSYSDTFYINDGDWNNYQVAANGNAFSRSIAGKEETWKRRLEQQGLLSR